VFGRLQAREANSAALIRFTWNSSGFIVSQQNITNVANTLEIQIGRESLN